MQSWIYRFANVVGPGLTHGVIYDFIRKLRANPAELEILGDGSQQKPYLHVDDCIEGILFGLEHSNDQVNIFNLGNTSSTCVTTIADMVVQMMGLTDVRYNYTGGSRGWPGDVPQVRYDTAKMRQLGWEPCLDSDEAVRKTIQTEIAV
jgi:UDP-glucose 4-epimerase